MVDFPAPFFPMRAILSVSLIAKDTSLNSALPPWMTEMLSTEIMKLGFEAAKVGNRRIGKLKDLRIVELKNSGEDGFRITAPCSPDRLFEDGFRNCFEVAGAWTTNICQFQFMFAFFRKKSLQNQCLTLEAGNWVFGSSVYFFKNLKV
jgi:hypothetical protein